MKPTAIHPPHRPETARQKPSDRKSRSQRSLRAVHASLIIGMMGLVGEACAATYHVETTGVDGLEVDGLARDGSAAQPWKTVSYAATRAVAIGDIIKVGVGTFEESSSVGLAPGVSIDGTGETQTLITSIANPVGPVKSCLISLGEWNNNILVAGNQTISNLTLDGRNHSVYIGVGSYGRNGFTVHDVTFTNFGLKAMVVQGANDPIWSAIWPDSPPTDSNYCRNIQIYDCVFLNSGLNYVGANWAYGALELNGVQDSVVKNCQFDETTYGGWGVKGRWLKNTNIHNCVLQVAPTDPVKGKDFSIEMWYAEDCQFFDNWANGAFSIPSNNNVRIHHNEIVALPGESASYGVEFGGVAGSASSSVDHNWFEGVLGVAIWTSWNDSLSIHHNVFHKCDNAVFARSNDWGVPDVNDGGAINDLRIYNNTLDECGSVPLWGGGAISLNAQNAIAPFTGSKIRNNIIANTTRATNAITLGGKNHGTSYTDQVTNTTITNNLFFNISAEEIIFQQPGVTGTVMTPNTEANPLFKGGSTPGASPYYELQAMSPAIGTGVDVGLPYLGNAPDLGAFVQPIGQRIEAEMNYSVAAEVGTNSTVGVSNLNLDSYKCIRLFDTGDTLRIHFKVPTAGYYDLGARVRSGSWTVSSNSNHNPTGYFANGYSYKVDGVSVPFTGDASSVSAPDPGAGGVYWGTMRSKGVYLPDGLHHLEIKMTSSWGFVDYLEVSGALAQGSHQDIGAVAAAGNSTYDPLTNRFTVTASGADIWNTADEFHYVYQTLTGDGEIIARVASLTNTNEWAKAGVMIRNTLAANSAHALMAVTPMKGAAFQLRATSGGVTTYANGLTGLAPYWVKIKRMGSSFTGYKSADGNTWTQVGATTTITMGSSVYVGLAITSHRDGTLATGVFDSVQVTH